MEQVRRLEAIHKRKVINLDEGDGNDNSFGKYWEYIELDEFES